MKNTLKKLIYLLLLSSSFLANSQQSIYKMFNEGMSKAEVAEVFQTSKSSLTNIYFGKDVAWDIATERFVYVDNQLKAVCLVPSGMGNGYNYIKTYTQLRKSKEFLLSLAYTITHENKWWERPQSFVNKNYPYGLILKGPKNKNYVDLYTYQVKGSYIPVLYIFPADYLETHFKDNEQASVQESGF